MRAMTRVLARCRTRLGKMVTSSGRAAYWTPRQVVVGTGSVGGSPGRRDGSGALCTIVADFMLCTSSLLLSR